MPLDLPKRFILGVSIATALLYLAGGGWLPFPAHVLAKGLTVSTLAVIAFRSRQPLLGLALGFGSLGDVLLDLDPRHLFVFGLGAFLLGHLMYITLFVRRRLSVPAPLSPPRLVTVALLLLYVVGFSWWLSPSLGALAVPVYAYMGAITLMAISAVCAGLHRPWVVAGAICFVASDSMLGAAKFALHGSFPGRDFLVWTTYCLAQYGLALGYLAE